MLKYKEKKYTHKDEESEMKQKESSSCLLQGSHQKTKIKTTFVFLARDGMRHTYSQACAVPMVSN